MMRHPRSQGLEIMKSGTPDLVLGERFNVCVCRKCEGNIGMAACTAK